MALIWSRDTPQRGEDECESSKMSRALPVINHEVGRTKSRKFTSAGPPGQNSWPAQQTACNSVQT